jgi:tetratricopeptide (TPR) repeat protein
MAKKIKIKKPQIDMKDLEAAAYYFQTGNLRQAELICRQILLIDPAHGETWHLLGIIAVNTGQLDEAIHYFNNAVCSNPREYSYYYNLGNAYADKGVPDGAIEAFNKALTLKPDSASAHNNLGRAFLNKGMLDEAIESFRKVLALAPSDANAYNSLGIAFYEKGLLEEAIENFRKALSFKRDFDSAYNNLATAFNKKGCMPDEAINCARKALALKPDYVEAFSNLGIAFCEKGLLEDAIENFKKALALKSDFEAYNNLATAFNKKGGMPDEAINCARKALALKPDYTEAFNNLGIAFCDKGLTDEAVKYFRKASELNPYNSKFHYNLGMAYLLKKDFDRGWEEYEWRQKLKANRVSPLTKPHWDGSSLKGKSIIVYAEQGYGDTLQFVRYLPDLYEIFSAKKVMFVSQEGLKQLLRESDLKAEILDLETPVDSLNFDTNIYLMSLPRVFRTNLENIPFKGKRYLKANEQRMKWYREKFFLPVIPACPQSLFQKRVPASGDDKNGINERALIKIGIFWQGNPDYQDDRSRSIPLHLFNPICRLPGVKVYSLQKGHGIEQLNGLPEDIEIVSLGETFNDFSDTAAAIENLDLVITIDTAVAHLSAALGKKTWILLPAYAEWRWHMDMEYSPWYEDVRLFRHKEPGKKDWAEMMQRVKGQIKVEIIGSLR